MSAAKEVLVLEGGGVKRRAILLLSLGPPEKRMTVVSKSWPWWPSLAGVTQSVAAAAPAAAAAAAVGEPALWGVGLEGGVKRAPAEKDQCGSCDLGRGAKEARGGGVAEGGCVRPARRCLCVRHERE